MIVDLVGCARCHSDGHPQLEFKPFTIPVEDYWTHWAMCPTVNEPILYCTVPAVYATPGTRVESSHTET